MTLTTESPVWRDPDGTSHALDGSNGVLVTRGIEGRGMPPMQTVTDELAGLDGTRPRISRAHERDTILPVVVYGADNRDRVRTLASLFDPRRGDGRLQVDGRELICRYREGLGLDESDGGLDADGSGWQRAVLVFVAHDPLWRDVDPTVELVNVEANTFLSSGPDDPWFPWQLVSSDAVGGFNVDNDGDDLAWPRWTIQGPGSGLLSLSNGTSGEKIEISSVSLAAGEQIAIDTRPGHKTVTGPGDTNLWPDLSDDSTLWPLERGSQTVTVTLEGAEAGVSNVRLEWRRKWLTV